MKTQCEDCIYDKVSCTCPIPISILYGDIECTAKQMAKENAPPSKKQMKLVEE